MDLVTHFPETLETESAPFRSLLSHHSRDGSSASARVPIPDMKTLNGSLRSSRFEALDDQGLVPTSPMVNRSSEFPIGEALGDQFLGPASTVIDGSSPSSHSKALANQSGPLVPSLLNPDGASLPLQSETLDGSLSSRFLAQEETLEHDDESLMLSSSLSSSSSSSSSSSPSLFPLSNSRWSSPWSWNRETKPPFSSYLPREIEPTMVGAGLVNLGNTCFLNAVLQCFTHTVPLVQGLRSCNHAMPCHSFYEGFCVLCTLRDHIELSLASSGRAIMPLKLVDNLNNISSSLQRYQQEDAHEFLQCLLDRLDSFYLMNQDKGSHSPDDNLVKHVFGGYLISKLRCCNCGHISDTYEPLIDLSLEIEDVDTLPCALESFTKVEKIEDPEMKFTCDNCKEEVSVEKQLLLDQVPLVAAFHLKRFKTDGTYVEKIDKHVEFPLELDLLPYTKEREDDNVELKYELYAIVEHTGFSSTSGHYFSYIRSSPDTWHRLDDSKVTSVPEDYVLHQEAYILFYARQGTPWFSSLMQTQKPCLDPNTSGNSPKSVLDNVDSISTSLPTLANVYSHEASETVDAADEISTCLSGGGRGDVVQVHEDGDVPHRVDTPMPLGVTSCFDGTLDHTQNIFTTSPRRDHDGNQHINENCNSKIHPQTPPRSPSPDIYAEEPPEVSYNIPRGHLRQKNQVACKKPLNKALEDSRKREACKLCKNMPASRSMRLMAAMKGSQSEGSLGKKKSKRRMESSANGESNTRARRKSNPCPVMPTVAAGNFR